jgi:tetratricopeptide (TPR) repeat protein
MVLTSAGRPEDALGLIRKALRLNPLPPNWYFVVWGDAERMLGQNQEAIGAYQKALDRVLIFSWFVSGWPPVIVRQAAESLTLLIGGRKWMQNKSPRFVSVAP